MSALVVYIIPPRVKVAAMNPKFIGHESYLARISAVKRGPIVLASVATVLPDPVSVPPNVGPPTSR